MENDGRLHFNPSATYRPPMPEEFKTEFEEWDDPASPPMEALFSQRREQIEKTLAGLNEEFDPDDWQEVDVGEVYDRMRKLDKEAAEIGNLLRRVYSQTFDRLQDDLTNDGHHIERLDGLRISDLTTLGNLQDALWHYSRVFSGDHLGEAIEALYLPALCGTVQARE